VPGGGCGLFSSLILFLVNLKQPRSHLFFLIFFSVFYVLYVHVVNLSVINDVANDCFIVSGW